MKMLKCLVQILIFLLLIEKKLLKNAIFGDIEIPAVIINTMSIDVYFHKLKEEPSYCSNITVYTNSSTVKAAFHYDDVKKKIILKTEKAN